MSDAVVNALFERIRNLSPADKLRLAAGLLEGKKPRLAKALIDRVAVELGAWLLVNKAED